ncbi:possible site-specific recombinase, phage integrase family protein (plasmid) [Rhodococcus jostii RHA1]|uniref:Possible site-specific recombinase, phage integrase family protein n=1 Tax=Rhodococcus jostii (strain RHA1) TaxID=101510 RepID=Q0RX14_RHOJR|nr:possible site-specific recombinase, phage integrase family protein [Rhodococcus jostii RHA1]
MSITVLVAWNHAGGRLFVPRCHHELRGPVDCVDDLGGEVAGPVPARAAEWLRIWTDLGRAPRTIDAYARGLAEYLLACEREGVDPVAATRAQIALFVRELRTRPSRRGTNVVALDSGSGLANATLLPRLVPVQLFYDFLVEEGIRYTAGRHFGGQSRPLVPRMINLSWIPCEAEWLQLLDVFRLEPIRNPLMLALAYELALRREELCSLRTDDLDPAHRMLRVRAETTKTRRGRVVAYSAATGCCCRATSPTGPGSCGEVDSFDDAPACAAHQQAHRSRRDGPT